MPVDTRGLRREFLGRRLRVEFTCGETAEVDLLSLTVCKEPEPCCGMTYLLHSTNRPTELRREGDYYWSGFNEIKSFDLLGD